MAGARATLSNPGLKALMFELELRDSHYPAIIAGLADCGLTETARFEVHPDLFNIWFTRGTD